MDDSTLLAQLENLAEALGLQVRHERLDAESAFPAGGLCRLRDRRFVILNEQASTAEKVRVLAGVLRRFDLTGHYVLPALREILEDAEEEF